MADTQNTNLPKNSTKEIGESGTLITAGIIHSEDYNRSLTGLSGIRAYEIVRRSDGTAHAALQVVKLPLLSANWKVIPPTNPNGDVDPADQKIADDLNHILFNEDFKFKRFLKEAVTCFDFGFSVFEIVLKPITTSDNRTLIGIDKLAFRKQLTIWKWETSAGQPGVTQAVMGKFYDIPREKLIIFSYDKEGDNYAGTSLLRHVYKDWDIKDKLTLVNAIALEKQGVGIPIIQAKDGVTPSPSDEDDAIGALSNMRANEAGYLKVPNTYSVEMLDMKGQTTKDILPTLVYHDGRIMSGVLARFMELGGAGGSGSQALARDLSSVFMKAEGAHAEELAEYIDAQLIRPLVDANYSAASLKNGYPHLQVSDIADDDIATKSVALSQLLTAGAITADVDVEESVRAMLNLPAMSQETRDAYEHKEDVLTPDDQATITNEAAKEMKKPGDPKVKAARAIQAARDYRNKLIDVVLEG